VCDHSWYQSRDRLFDVRDGFEFIKLPETEKERIAKNIEAGRSPDYVGEYKLYVGNLDFRCTETDLRDVFSKAGDIGEVNIVTDNETGRSRGFAFVTMINEADGIKAKEAYDGTELLGRQLSIREPNN
jgi:RNA recognition motif-containing protein